ncbi:MAG: 30S ribosomal protein S21 [candidate division WOR-3 bacterium]
MNKIIVKPNEPFDSFIRRFRGVVERAGILKDTKRKEFYEKPSEKRRRIEAERRRKRFRRWREEF